MRQLFNRLFQRRGNASAAAVVEPAPPPIALSREWVQRRRQSPATYAALADSAIEGVRTAVPSIAANVVTAAERVLRHEFDLLGSGPFSPRDPDRPVRDGYQPIDWFLDPVRGLRFAAKVSHTQWRADHRPGNADIKYPWELARCQHWVTLAQAYRLTDDARFGHEIARELDDFVEANPTGVGVNWTCTMDVGLRVVSWIVALDIVRDCDALDDAFWMRAYTALHDHGTFIRGNLENKYEVTSNHFLSNIVGLWYLAAFFDDQESGQAWSSFAREMLEQEIDVQVLPDGADFESSVPYHRLVAELFLGCVRLAEFRGEPLSPHSRDRVRGMIDYLAAVQRPDDLMPQSGDADDGRLHVFSGVGMTTPQDARHLFGPAAAMFGTPEWSTAGGEPGRWEAAWWGVTPPREQQATASAAPLIRLFPDAGHVVARQRGSYLLITNGIVGTKGFGNHKHNDQLSFEYHVGGQPIVVDPGSYVYTSDPAARNLFRSTRYHNTVMVDGVEQNEINPEWLFRTFERANPEHVAFESGEQVLRYTGRHTGYERLAQPVRHERTFRFEADAAELEIADSFSGRGSHELRWHFHLAPGVAVQQRSGGLALTIDGRSVALLVPDGLPDATIVDAFYSPSYGVRVPCRAIEIVTTVRVEISPTWTFRFVPQT